MSCFLTVEAQIPARDIALLEVSRENSSHSEPKTLNVGNSISTDKVNLRFAGFSTADSMIALEYTDKQTNHTEMVEVKLQYWEPWIQHNFFKPGGQNDGDYIFRPKKGQFEPLTYGNYSNHATYVDGEVDSKMTFYFSTPEKIHGSYHKVIVHVSIDRDLHVLKVDVDWDSLPASFYNGHEAIVDFSIHNFTNNQTFYTDSNGLEMQKRILNYRPTWNLSLNYNDSLENVTANYYPINSAVQIKDIYSDRVFTVMNDRPQAGSALKEGAIQLMQNRRIPARQQRHGRVRQRGGQERQRHQSACNVLPGHLQREREAITPKAGPAQD